MRARSASRGRGAEPALRPAAVSRAGELLARLVLGLALAVLFLLGLLPHTGWYRTETVLSGSMRPTFAPGDLVVVTPERIADVRVGQMISYHIPLERYPDTHNQQPLAIAALANQKRYVSLYLMGIYANDDDAWWFREQWTLSGKRLDMGKSCVRFRQLDDVPLDVVGAAIARTSADDLIADYERSRDTAR